MPASRRRAAPRPPWARRAKERGRASPGRSSQAALPAGERAPARRRAAERALARRRAAERALALTVRVGPVGRAVDRAPAVCVEAREAVRPAVLVARPESRAVRRALPAARS